jgi:hypothetical protein
MNVSRKGETTSTWDGGSTYVHVRFKVLKSLKKPKTARMLFIALSY